LGGGIRGLKSPRVARAISSRFQGTLPPENLIQRTEFAQRLTDGLQLKERSSIPTVSPDVQPVIILDDLSTSLEGAKGERRRYAASHAQGGVALEYGQQFLFMPAGSAFVCLPQNVTFALTRDPDATSVGFLNNIARLFMTAADPFVADPQQAGTPLNTRATRYEAGNPPFLQDVVFSSARAQGRNDLSSNFGYLIGDYVATRGSQTVDLRGIVLIPGAGLVLSSANVGVDTGIAATWVWDEVPVVR
jgi:hypothetical protein